MRREGKFEWGRKKPEQVSGVGAHTPHLYPISSFCRPVYSEWQCGVSSFSMEWPSHQKMRMRAWSLRFGVERSSVFLTCLCTVYLKVERQLVPWACVWRFVPWPLTWRQQKHAYLAGFLWSSLYWRQELCNIPHARTLTEPLEISSAVPGADQMRKHCASASPPLLLSTRAYNFIISSPSH